MKHKLEVIPKEEILANRSNAYEFIDFDKQETLRDKLESLVVQWHQRQEHYVDVAYKHVDDAHNNRKFTYKAMATRDCWKELLTLLNSHKDDGEIGSLVTAQGEIRPANFFSWFERFKKK